MHVALEPLNSAQEAKIKDCFMSEGFGLLLDSIEAEYVQQVHDAKLPAVELLFDSSLDLDVRTELRKAGLLKIALDVIQERITSPTHYTIHIEP